MSIFALVMLTFAVALVVAAEWPRLSARFGGERRAQRARERRKRELTVIEGEGDAQDDFAASVERDLAQLPVIEERDDWSRR